MSKKKSSKTSESNKKIEKTNLQILPIRFYDENVGGFILEDKSYMGILQILPKDRKNLQQDELQYEIFHLAKFYKLYAQDIKLISLNFPVNTSQQRAILSRAIKRTTDEVRKLWLEREIEELLLLDNNVNRREFFLFFYGRNREDYVKNHTNITQWMGNGRSKFVADIKKEKKIQIIRKICNMNTLILADELEEI